MGFNSGFKGLIHTGMLHTLTPFVTICPVTKESIPLCLC